MIKYSFRKNLTKILSIKRKIDNYLNDAERYLGSEPLETIDQHLNYHFLKFAESLFDNDKSNYISKQTEDAKKKFEQKETELLSEKATIIKYQAIRDKLKENNSLLQEANDLVVEAATDNTLINYTRQLIELRQKVYDLHDKDFSEQASLQIPYREKIEQKYEDKVNLMQKERENFDFSNFEQISRKSFGGTLLHQAVLAEDTDRIKSLLAQNNNDLLTTDQDGQTPLHKGITSIDIVQPLDIVQTFKDYLNEQDFRSALNKPTDISKMPIILDPEAIGLTPARLAIDSRQLHKWAQNSQWDMVLHIINNIQDTDDKCAAVTTSDNSNKTLLQIAKDQNNTEMMTVLENELYNTARKVYQDSETSMNSFTLPMSMTNLDYYFLDIITNKINNQEVDVEDEAFQGFIKTYLVAEFNSKFIDANLMRAYDSDTMHYLNSLTDEDNIQTHPFKAFLDERNPISRNEHGDARLQIDTILESFKNRLRSSQHQDDNPADPIQAFTQRLSNVSTSAHQAQNMWSNNSGSALGDIINRLGTAVSRLRALDDYNPEIDDDTRSLSSNPS